MSDGSASGRLPSSGVRMLSAPQAAETNPPRTFGFTRHLEAAINQNESRKAVYAQLSHGATKSLSDQLILYERLSLLPALYLDWRAKSFNERGIPVVTGDFESMSKAKTALTPPKYRGQASQADCDRLKTWLKNYRADLDKAVSKSDFKQAATLTYQILRQVEGLEEQTKSHFAMTRHIIESIGEAAMNAMQYQKQTNGGTDGLCRQFLKVQSLGLMDIVPVDQKAQRFQAQGIGIVVNDVPEIPFQRRWERMASQNPSPKRRLA
jgi:hypothetical protein